LILIAPKGQTMMHVKQPMHLSSSCATNLVVSSMYIAPVRQAKTQAGSGQCLH
jgi:hypothetical protein